MALTIPNAGGSSAGALVRASFRARLQTFIQAECIVTVTARRHIGVQFTSRTTCEALFDIDVALA